MAFEQTRDFSDRIVEKKPLILSVEDEEDNQNLINFILEILGYPYVTAANGQSALELIQSCQPTLILLDIVLPDINGLEVVRRLKQDPKTTKIPIIAITAMARDRDREQILAAGCEDYICKPYTSEQLEKAIDRYL